MAYHINNIWLVLFGVVLVRVVEASFSSMCEPDIFHLYFAMIALSFYEVTYFFSILRKWSSHATKLLSLLTPYLLRRTWGHKCSRFVTEKTNINTCITVSMMDLIDASREKWVFNLTTWSPMFLSCMNFVFHMLFNTSTLFIVVFVAYHFCNLFHASLAVWHSCVNRDGLYRWVGMKPRAPSQSSSFRLTLFSVPIWDPSLVV